MFVFADVLVLSVCLFCYVLVLLGGFFWPPQLRLLTMLWSFEKDTILTP